jgi:hypothetical protein
VSADERFVVAGLNEYTQALGIQSGQLDPDLAKFAARLRLAANLESVQIANLSEESSRGYLALMKISFAYSALEIISKDKAIKGRIAIMNTRLANTLKSEKFCTLQDYLRESAETKTTRGELEKFFSGSSSDLIPVIRAIRNTMFHGVLTPHAGGTPTKTRLKALEALSAVTVTEVNNLGRSVIESRQALRMAVHKKG